MLNKIYPSKMPREEKIRHAILLFLRASIAVAIAWGLAKGEWEVFFISILALGLTFIPEFIKARYHVQLPISFDVVIVLFVFSSVFLGEIGDVYERFWWWDAVLHIASGVVLGFTGLLILTLLFYRKKLTATPFWIAVFAFSFGLGLGAVWEIFEFTVDQNFGTNMQKNGLHDTMWDLIIDAAGSFAVAWGGYIYFKSNGIKGPVGNFIERFLDINPKLNGKK